MLCVLGVSGAPDQRLCVIAKDAFLSVACQLVEDSCECDCVV